METEAETAQDAAARTMLDRLRERQLVVPLLGVVLMCILIVAFMPRALTGQATLGAVDMLEPKSPWRDALDRRPDVASPVQTDQVENIPTTVRFYEDLKAGRYTLWLDGHGGGQPLGTLPLGALLSPAGAVFLLFPAWFAIGLKTALMLLAGYGGTYLLLRRLDVGQAVAVVGGIAFTFCGTNLVYIHRLEGALLLPAVLWGLHRVADRPTARTVAVPAVLLAVTWLEGFPAVFVFCIYLGGAWYAWLLYRQFRRGPGPLRRWLVPRLVAGAGAVVWALGIAMVQLVPFLLFITSSGVLDVRHYDSSSHIGPAAVFGILDINLFGDPAKGPWYLGANPYEGLATAGLLVSIVALAAMGFAVAGRIRGTRAQRDAWPWFVVMTAVTLVLCFFGTPLLGLAYKLPGISENGLWRIRFAMNLGLVVTAAIGADALLSRRRESDRLPRWSTLAAVAVSGVLVAMQIPDVARLLHSAGYRRLAVAVGIQLALTAIVIALWFLARKRPTLLWVAVVAAAGVLFSQLAWPMRTFTPQAPKDDFYPTLAAQQFIADTNGDDYRFAATEWNFYPNSAVLDGTMDLRGQTLRTRAFKDLVSAAEPNAFVRDPLKIILLRDEWQLASPALDELSVNLFALGTEDTPFGTIRPLDSTIGPWRPITDGEVVARTPLPALAGIGVPLRADSAACDGAHVQLTLSQDGREVATTSRPAYDAADDWTDFGLMGQSLDPNSPSEVAVSVTGDPGCTVSVGTSTTDPGRAALRTFDPDPALPLVSTEQAWIYRRPTALPLVRAYGTWTAFDDQAALLHELTTRPATDSTIGLVTGSAPAPPATPSQVEVLSSSMDDGVVKAEVRSSGPALVTGGNDLATGWTVTVDGEQQSLVAVDGAILGVVVPEGVHQVEFRYRPRSFTAAVPVTIFSLLAVVAVAFDAPERLRRGWNRRRRTGGPGRAAGPP